jgi:hypothetical protein
MTTAYTTLTPEEQSSHLNMASIIGRSGIYPSGEAHFFDSSVQNATDNITNIVNNDKSIFQFNGLSNQFSNATTEYFIDDFTIFNPYRHNSNEFTVNTASLLIVAPIKFNIYSNSFRQWNL